MIINSVCIFMNSVCMSTCEDAAYIWYNENFVNVLQSNVNVSHVNVMKPKNVSQVSYTDSALGNIQSRKRKQVESETLAKRWNIDHKKALKTVKRTTWRGIRNCLHPFLSRSYPTNDCMMCYNRLPHSMISDTMKSDVVSKKGNKYDQDYCTQYGWSSFLSMKLNSEAQESLSMLFKCNGIPTKVVVGNSKEQSLGKFSSKCCKSDCNLVNTEAYSP